MPQVLKDDIKNKILKTALNEFLTKGYLNTSMKGIALGAGIAVGNIYNYFKDKEELYATIGMPVISAIDRLLGSPPETMDIAGIEKKLIQFIDIYKGNEKIFIMLISNSRNTRFERMRDNIVEKFAQAISRWKNLINGGMGKKDGDIFIKAFAESYITGVVSILSEKIEEEDKLLILYDYLSFMKDAIYKKFVKKAVV